MKLQTALATLVVIATPMSALADASRDAVVEDLFEAFNEHDVDKLMTFYADDVIVHGPESCEPKVGKEAVRASYTEMFEQIPDVHDEVDLIVTQGDMTAVTFTASSNIPGYEFEMPIAVFFKMEDGLVVEDRVFFDSDITPDCS